MSGIASDCDNGEIMSYVSSRLGLGCFRSFNGISKGWKQNSLPVFKGNVFTGDVAKTILHSHRHFNLE